jgi:hypothetical protein
VIRYRYNHQFSPSAPFVHVSLQDLEGAAAIADLTVVPAELAERLGLVPFGTV